jgi:hypothetical protein
VPAAARPPPPPVVDTVTAAASTSTQQQLLLCNGLVSTAACRPQLDDDGDSLSGHFTDVSLNSPDDDSLCGGGGGSREIVSHVTTA